MHAFAIVAGVHQEIARALNMLLAIVGMFWRHNPHLGHPLNWVRCTLASAHHAGRCLHITIGERGVFARWSG